MKILLVEDEKRMSEALCEILRQEKYDTDGYVTYKIRTLYYRRS